MQSDFLSQQKKFDRVNKAFSEKGKVVQQQLNEIGLQPDDFHMLVVAYKEEDELEIYVKRKTESIYKKLVSYEVCAKSGQLGPKRKQGDGQVPEGFYHIDRFNPYSYFHLSLGLNYPNDSDRKKSKAKHLGGDIFIHGSCVTIGCLPMTDEKIKEIYLYAVYAKNNGQTMIPVYLFPFKMTNANFISHKEMSEYKNDEGLIHFWENLRIGFDKFHKEKVELKTGVDNNGGYTY
ncbi:hypothetical protein BH09BAC3_BH09BAC3_15110 [soil metagenome]